MANTAQSKKRARQNVKRALNNKSQLSTMRTAIKSTKQSLSAESASKEKTAEQFRKTASLIDRGADKELIHKNKAARLKSRLNKKIKASLTSNG
jgi:small subunit ribosomal protein S20